MRLPTLLKHGLLAVALAATVHTAHAVTAATPTVLADTVTELKIDWSWLDGSGNYLGQNWNAWFTPTWDDTQSAWLIDVSYQHLDGPHGELAEALPHALPTLTVLPKAWAAQGGVDDHRPPTLHVLAHSWALGAIGATQTQAGWAALNVTHAVPEPGTWLMLAGGLAMLGLRARRRR